MGFVKDLEFGKQWEEYIIQHMLPEDETFQERAPNKAFKDWDFKTNAHSYEVKSDRLAHKYNYGSMFIEFECGGVPSGIMASKADYWFYVMVSPDDSMYSCYEIPTSKLREAIPHAMRTVKGGDGWRSRGYIMNTNLFEQYKIV